MAGDDLRATLRGSTAQLGEVRARDVARLIEGLESALAAAAYATLGRPRRGNTGRHRAAIEAAARLRFSDVSAGSVVVNLRLPRAEEDSSTLDLGIDDLAGAAFDRLVLTFDLPDADVDRGIAKALAELAEELGIGERHDELLVSSPTRQASLRLDRDGRGRMRRLADTPLQRQTDVLQGDLREADFDKMTARLRVPTGEMVTVAFAREHEERIYEVLRGHAQLEGMVTYDPVTSSAKRVDVRRVTSPELLPFERDSFWNPVSIADLAEAQGIVPAELDQPLEIWTDAEREDLLVALAEIDG